MTRLRLILFFILFSTSFIKVIILLRHFRYCSFQKEARPFEIFSFKINYLPWERNIQRKQPSWWSVGSKSDSVINSLGKRDTKLVQQSQPESWTCQIPHQNQVSQVWRNNDTKTTSYSRRSMLSHFHAIIQHYTLLLIDVFSWRRKNNSHAPSIQH